MSQRKSEILVVGGGVIGLSVAWHLGKQGRTVTVLDAGEPGQASSAAAGMLAPLAEAAAPDPFLSLALDSLGRYPAFVDALREQSGQELDICGPGMLRVARTDDEEAVLCRAMDWQPALGLPLHRLTGTEVRRLEPCAAPDIQAAIISPAERYIEPHRLLSALSLACRHHGVQLLTQRAICVEMMSSRVIAARTATDVFTAEILIVAGGAWSPTLGQWLGMDIPVTPLRGQILALGPQLPRILQHTLYTHGAYLVPRSDGRIVAGATEEWAGFQSQTTPAGIAGLRADAARLVPSLADWPLHSAWAGLRPVSADGLPLLGRVPGWDNVHVAAGHGRNGILLAPITGALLANSILHDAALPAAFDPARFGGDAMTPVILTIAGSDPGGGAGIQADLRTFAALGVVGVSAITALTVQNSLGVQSVHPVAADILAAQIDAVLSDTKVSAVKIGMLGGADQIRAVAAALRKYSPPNVVLDPVLASTGGIALLDEAGIQALMTELMPLCDLVTPNLMEAAFLTGAAVESLKAMQTAAETLLAGGVKAVLVKGGHLPDEPHDLLLTSGGNRLLFTDRRVDTPHTHGTGCLLSAAIAAHLAEHLPIEEAVQKSKALLTRALLSPVTAGRGCGHPDVAAGAKAALEGRTHLERLSLLSGIYVVTDPDLRPDRSPQEVLSAALTGGATIVQLREKHLPLPHLIALARELNTLARGAGALFLVNDRVDVALASDADGVHLGPDDMRPIDARRLLGPDKLVGVSVATLGEAEAAAPYASYFGVGAIFGSKTKLDAGAAIGVGRIREIKAAFPRIPIVAIGGINLGNIGEVAAAGADAAAVVSAVVTAPDIAEAVHELARQPFSVPLAVVSIREIDIFGPGTTRWSGWTFDDRVRQARRRAVPGLDVVEIGKVDLPILVGKLVTKCDPERFQATPGFVIGPDPVGADEEKDVGDDLLAVGRMAPLNPNRLASHGGDERVGGRAKPLREFEEPKFDPMRLDRGHPIDELDHDRPSPGPVLSSMRQDRLSWPRTSL